MAVELKALLRILADVRDLKKGTQELKTFHKSLFSIRNIIKGGIGIGAGVLGVRAIGSMTRAVGDLRNNVVSANLEYERTIQILKAVSGSQAEALRLYDLSVAKANQYGQQIDVTAGSLGRLMAASKGTKLEGQGTLDIWESLITTGTVLQLNQEEMTGIFRATEQMISKGNVQAEELRGQLGERLPGAFQIAARAMGITTQELDKLLKKGEVTAEELLPLLSRELRKSFGPEVQSAAQSTQARINRLNTELALMYQTLGQSGFMDTFAEGVADLSTLIKDPQFQEGLNKFAEGLGKVAELTLKAASSAGKLYGVWQNMPFWAQNLIFPLAADRTPPGQTGAGLKGAPAGVSVPQPTAPQTPPTVNLPGMNVESLDVMAIYERDLARVLYEQKRLTTDTLTAQADKQTELNELLVEELLTRQTLVNERALQIQGGIENASEELQIYKEIQAHLLRIAEIENERRTQSFFGGFQESFINLADDTENMGTRIGDVFTGGINSAIASTSQSLSALAFQTDDFGESFLRILQGVVVGLIQVGLQEAALYGIRSLFRAKETSEVIAAESAKAPLLQANAAAASIGTAGVAAASGMTWALVAIGAITAALAFREQGGPVTAGRPYIVGEKRPEVFIPAQNGFIAPSLDAAAGMLAPQYVAPGLDPASGVSAQQPAPMNVALVASYKDAEEWLETQKGRGRIVQIMKEERGALLS